MPDNFEDHLCGQNIAIILMFFIPFNEIFEIVQRDLLLVDYVHFQKFCHFV